MRQEMAEGFAALRGEFEAHRQENTAEFRAMRREMAEGFAALRGEFEAHRQENTAEFRAVRQEMAAEFKSVRQEIAELREIVRRQLMWMMATMLTIGGLIIAVVTLVR